VTFAPREAVEREIRHDPYQQGGKQAVLFFKASAAVYFLAGLSFTICRGSSVLPLARPWLRWRPSSSPRADL